MGIRGKQHFGARSALARNLVFPCEYLDFLCKSKEDSTLAREARRGRNGMYSFVNTGISFGNQRETAPRRAKRAGENPGYTLCKYKDFLGKSIRPVVYFQSQFNLQIEHYTFKSCLNLRGFNLPAQGEVLFLIQSSKCKSQSTECKSWPPPGNLILYSI